MRWSIVPSVSGSPRYEYSVMAAQVFAPGPPAVSPQRATPASGSPTSSGADLAPQRYGGRRGPGRHRPSLGVRRAAARWALPRASSHASRPSKSLRRAAQGNRNARRCQTVPSAQDGHAPEDRRRRGLEVGGRGEAGLRGRGGEDIAAEGGDEDRGQSRRGAEKAGAEFATYARDVGGPHAGRRLPRHPPGGVADVVAPARAAVEGAPGPGGVAQVVPLRETEARHRADERSALLLRGRRAVARARGWTSSSFAAR
jgi:hypothetical protein